MSANPQGSILAFQEANPINLIHPPRPWVRALPTLSAVAGSFKAIAEVEEDGFDNTEADFPITSAANGIATLEVNGSSRLAIKAFSFPSVMEDPNFDIRVFGLNLLQLQPGQSQRHWIADHLATLRFVPGNADVPAVVSGAASCVWADAVSVEAHGKALTVPDIEELPEDALANGVAMAVLDGLSPHLLMLHIPAGCNALVMMR